MKVREFELYKAFYCGLCKTMGKKISRFSRITLNYDMVFLALLRILLKGEKIEDTAFRCKLKPLKKRYYITSGEPLLYSACVSANLSYFKYMDDVSDETNRFKRLLLKIFFPAPLLFSRMKKKSRKYYPGIEDRIAPPLEKLSKLEKQSCHSIDLTSSCFAELMENIICFEISGPESQTARTMGRHLGKWLYMTDALDDFEKDLKKGSYNPFVAYYGEKGRLCADMEMIKFAMNSSLGEIEQAFSLLETEKSPCVGSIVSNIIRLGLRDKQKQVLNKFDPEVKKHSGQSI